MLQVLSFSVSVMYRVISILMQAPIFNSFAVTGKLQDFLRASVSDIDTDDARAEAETSPWPMYIKEAVWKGNVRYIICLGLIT
jgi:hypothetical protein